VGRLPANLRFGVDEFMPPSDQIDGLLGNGMTIQLDSIHRLRASVAPLLARIQSELTFAPWAELVMHDGEDFETGRAAPSPEMGCALPASPVHQPGR
jgi:hypothetical protein